MITQIDNILISSEIDPDSSGNWSLEIFVAKLREFWNGTIHYLLYDSTYFLHQWRISSLTKYDKKRVVISIDQKLEHILGSDVCNIGPVFIPISKMSLHTIESQVNFVKVENKQYYTSFIGKVYDYRATAISSILKNGINLEVNPHVNTVNGTSYMSYLQVLVDSKYTINFSRTNKMKIKQLKCRMLESMLLGCVVLSDDKSQTRMLFHAGTDFIYVKNWGKLKGISISEMLIPIMKSQEMPN